MSTQEVIDRAVLGPLEYIAEGGQGRVFRCQTLRLPDYDGPLAFKEYKPGQVTAAGLEAIIGVRSRLDDETRHRLDQLSTWPTRLVQENGRVTGILMPLIRDEYVHVGRSLTGSILRKEREIQYLFLSAQRCEKLGFPRVNVFQRFAICEDLASAFALLAANNVVFGDLNAKNALFALGPHRTDAALMLVDCDAVRVRGTMSAVPQLNSPDWEPPVAERAHLTQQTDVYKYGLFVLRCLSPGPQASTARDPRRADRILDPAGQAMLRATLSDNRDGRPSAAQWAAYFAALRQSRAAAAGSGGRPASTPASPPTPTPSPAPAPATGGSAAPTPTVPPSPTSSGPPSRSQPSPEAGADPGGWTRAPDGSWVRQRHPR